MGYLFRQQNGEIKDARSFKNQAIIMVGSLIVTAFCSHCWRWPGAPGWN